MVSSLRQMPIITYFQAEGNFQKALRWKMHVKNHEKSCVAGRQGGPGDVVRG